MNFTEAFNAMKYTTVCVQKKLTERLIAVAAEVFSQKRRIKHDYYRNESLSECVPEKVS